MDLNDLQNEVARRVDTPKTQINVAETKRVVSMTFEVLSELEGAEMMALLAKGLAHAKRRREL